MSKPSPAGEAASSVGVNRLRIFGRKVPLASASLPSLLRWGLAAALVLTTSLFVQQAVLGRSPFGEPGEWNDVWVAVLHCLLASYLPAAYLAVLIMARRTEVEVRAGSEPPPALSVDAGLPPASAPTRGWMLAGAVGLVFGVLGPWLTEPHLGGPAWFWQPDRWSAEVYWHRLLGLWIVCWLGWFAYALIRVSRRVSRLAREIPDFDLFDARIARPFVRLGLGNALVAAGLMTVLGLLGLDQGVTLMLITFGSVAVVLMGAATLLPIVGVRQRIGAARQHELTWCEAAIAGERNRLRQGEPGAGQNQLADLVAYRGLVEDLNLWVIDVPALRRFVLYLLIPFLSWIASAVGQDIIQRWMNRL